MFPRFPPQGTIKDLADNAVTDAKIAAHTTTKITVPYSLLTLLALVNADIAASAAIAISKLGSVGADNEFIRSNGTSWVSEAVTIGITETAEQSTTPVVDDESPTGMQNNRFYAFFTLPTTEKFYRIVGIEWKNGAVVAGDVVSGVDYVDANPPVLVTAVSAARGITVAQAGINSVQRASIISSDLIRGGTVLGAWFNPSGSTGEFKRLINQASQNSVKTLTHTAITPTVDITAWAAATYRLYVKVYFRGYS